jgi:hypothetical protein
MLYPMLAPFFDRNLDYGSLAGGEAQFVGNAKHVYLKCFRMRHVTSDIRFL